VIGIDGLAATLNATPPEVAFYAGFMTALALRRSRTGAILDRILPPSGD
jgi:hypothetical protein